MPSTGDSRPSACFGGAPAAVATLRARTWRGSTEPRRQPRVALAWPRVAEGVALDRAIGCMLGQVIGDSLGSLVEFQPRWRDRAAYPAGCATWRRRHRGARWPGSRPTIRNWRWPWRAAWCGRQPTTRRRRPRHTGGGSPPTRSTAALPPARALRAGGAAPAAKAEAAARGGSGPRAAKATAR